VAVATVRETARAGDPAVVFCCFSEADAAHYRAALGA